MKTEEMEILRGRAEKRNWLWEKIEWLIFPLVFIIVATVLVIFFLPVAICSFFNDLNDEHPALRIATYAYWVLLIGISCFLIIRFLP